MTLQLGDTVPDFEAETTDGPIRFHDFIGDGERKVAGLFGMIHPKASGTMTVRSVFIIGPDKTLKLSLTYPASTGRNFDEIVRALDSLQLTAAAGVATPVNWRDGDDCIVPPTVSTEDAQARYGAVEEQKPYLRYVKQPW